MPPTPPRRKKVDLTSRRRLANTLTATPGVKRTSQPGAVSPKSGFQFVQKSGPRAGQSFNVVTGKSGLGIRKYETGDTARASGDAGVSAAAQKRDVGARGQKLRPDPYEPPKGGFDSSGPEIDRKRRARRILSGRGR